MLNRRNLLAGLGISLAAPAIIKTPGLLMPVQRIKLAHATAHDLNRAQFQAIMEGFARLPPSAFASAAFIESATQINIMMQSGKRSTDRNWLRQVEF